MSATKRVDDANRETAVQELLIFVRDFAKLMDQSLIDTRKIMEKTVEQMMGSVSAINEAADLQLKKADEVLVKDTANQKFVSKSAKDLDSQYANPAARVKLINEQISSQMASLSHLDDSVRSVLFSIMGALSSDDVIRQRLEHVTTSINAMENGIGSVVKGFGTKELGEADVHKINSNMADTMYRSYTMEEEKSVFKSILGDIKNFRKS